MDCEHLLVNNHDEEGGDGVEEGGEQLEQTLLSAASPNLPPLHLAILFSNCTCAGQQIISV